LDSPQILRSPRKVTLEWYQLLLIIDIVLREELFLKFPPYKKMR